METLKDGSLAASPVQWAVLQWLFNYPGVYLCWSDMLDNHVNWTSSWANEQARQGMIAVTGELGITDTAERTKPRLSPLPGRTPRIHFNTFKALLREGLICRYNDANGKPTHYFQLSSSAKQHLEEYRLDEMMVSVSPKENK